MNGLSETQPRPSQTSEMKNFETIANSWKLITVANHSVLDACVSVLHAMSLHIFGFFDAFFKTEVLLANL